MLIVLTALFLIALFALPFLPGIVEWIRKRDAEPLFIPMEYIRNPRYFGNSFRRILKDANADSESSPGIRTLTLSKEEKVEITRSVHFGENLAIDHLVYTRGDLTSDGHVFFNKELYVTGNVAIGCYNVIQAIAGDGDITLAEGTKCRRWLDAEGTIRTGRNCRLGMSVSSGDKIFLGKNCLFHRLFGMPIVTGREKTVAAHTAPAPSLPQKLLSNGLTFKPLKDRAIPPGAVVNENVVFLNDVEVGAGARLKGSIKSHGTLTIKEDVVVEGNIFSDGDIIIGRNAAVYGHVFSQMTVRIAGQSAISCSNKIKTVVGKKAVFLEPDVTIYGFLATEGEGKTIEQESCG
ncbi:MAG: hypothetical protein JXR49_17100 [Acidobacteria bacterium]|nr:hypothetical protein [Acidobacteriota bacterium]